MEKDFQGPAAYIWRVSGVLGWVGVSGIHGGAVSVVRSFPSAVMLSSMARLWPANLGQLGLAWIVGVLRFLHVTFLKSFPSLAVGRENSDENGHAVRKDEAGSKLVSSASSGTEPVRDEAVSKAVEAKPSRAPTQIDGNARKGGKERKGKATGRTHGKWKQKAQKVPKNEAGAESGKSCDAESRKPKSESNDTNQEQCTEVKNTEEECFEDCDEEILPLEQRCEMEDRNKDDDNIGIIDAELASDDLSQDVHYQATNGMELSNFAQSAALPVETVAMEAVWPGRNRPRKKRRRAKGSKQGSSVSTLGDRNLLNHSRIGGEFIGMVDDCPSSHANCILALPAVNSTMFGGLALGNSRQKPSARVHPSRSTSAIDCALTSSEYDLSPEPKASLVDVVLPVGSEIDAVKSPSLFVNLRQNSVKICSFAEFGEGSAKMSGSLSSDVVTPVQRSYDSGIRVGSEVSCCDSVVESRCFTPSSFYELSHFGKCLSTSTKPQNFVNSHSMFDSTEAKLTHPGLRSVEVRPSYVEPPRFKPRSLVNPLPAGPMLSGANCNVLVETAAPEVINKPDLISVQGTATQIMESLVVNKAQKGSSGFEERRPSKLDEEGFHDFACSDCRSDSFPRCCNEAVVNGVCHENGFHGNQESSHSVVKLIRFRTDKSRTESSPVRATRLIAHEQPAYTRGNRGRSSGSISDPIHRYFRNSVAKESGPFVKKTKDKPPRSLPRNERRAGFRTRSAIQEYIQRDELQRIAEMNFNLRRAQQFLHLEYLIIVEKQKQKNCDVVIFTSN